jgi:hypothetical protein
MSFYAEHWTARPAWTALSVPERIAVLDQLAPVVDAFRASGATLVGVAMRETRLLHRDDCHYVALWHLSAGPALASAFRAALTAAGWDRYFAPAGPEPTADATVPPPRDARDRRGVNGRSA